MVAKLNATLLAAALAAAALTAATPATAATAATAARGCVPAGATVLVSAPAGKVSVYRFPGGPMTACDGRTMRTEFAGWRDATDKVHGFNGYEDTEVVAASDNCVAYTDHVQDDNPAGRRPSLVIVDVPARKMTSAAIPDSDAKGEQRTVKMEALRMTRHCAAAVSYSLTPLDPHWPTKHVLETIDADGSTVIDDGRSFDQAFAGLKETPLKLPMQSRPKLPRRPLVLAARPALVRSAAGAVSVRLKLPTGTRGLSLFVAGRAVAFNWSLVQDPGLSWSLTSTAPARTVVLPLSTSASATLTAGRRYRVTSTVCTVGCVTERALVRLR